MSKKKKKKKADVTGDLNNVTFDFRNAGDKIRLDLPLQGKCHKAWGGSCFLSLPTAPPHTGSRSGKFSCQCHLFVPYLYLGLAPTTPCRQLHVCPLAEAASSVDQGLSFR